jgi:protein tyrosine phosphatase
VSLFLNLNYLQIKCHQYWPTLAEGAIVFGDLQITPLTEEIEEDIEMITRAFNISSVHEKSSRTVIHYQYLGWPDHDVPRDSKPIRVLIERTQSKKPIVVHCRYMFVNVNVCVFSVCAFFFFIIIKLQSKNHQFCL